MTELTEQQEQEMIERAKAGDPEANYQMSLWALEQAMAEPTEERWNRLAAKCLVKAAEAGYGPAKAKMDELLQAAEAKNAAEQQRPAAQSRPSAQSRPAAQQRPAAKRPRQTVSPAAGVSTSEQLNKVAGQAGAAAKKAGKIAGKAAVKAGKAIAAGTSALAKKTREGLAKASQARAEGSSGSSGGSHTGKKQSILPDFSQWDDAKWKKMQTICVVVCVILAILIAILIISGNKRKNKAPEEEVIQLPVAEVAPTPEPTTAPAPEPEPEPEEETFPGQAILDEIQAATLDVYPAETDYITAPKTVTVATNGGTLRLRGGPGTSYTHLADLPYGAELPVYANKNGWALVEYNGTWGWCSYDYLKS